jgi:autotransporter-associated beta strand protein
MRFPLESREPSNSSLNEVAETSADIESHSMNSKVSRQVCWKLLLGLAWFAGFGLQTTNVVAQRPTTISWKGSLSGGTDNWSTAANWSGRVVPNDTNVLASIEGDFTQTKIIRVDSATLGSLNLNDTTATSNSFQSIILDPVSSDSRGLRFSASNTNALVSVGGGSDHRIDCRVDINTNVNLTVRGTGSSLVTPKLVLDGSVSGKGSIFKSRTATLVLRAENTFSGGIVHGGNRLILASYSNTVLGTGAFTFRNEQAATADTAVLEMSTPDRTYANNFINDNPNGRDAAIVFSSIGGYRVQTFTGSFSGGANGALSLRAYTGNAQTVGIADGTIRLRGNWSGYNSSSASAIKIDSGSILIDSANSMASTGGYEIMGNTAAAKLILGGAYSMSNNVSFTGTGGQRNSFGARNASGTTATLSGNVAINDPEGANLFAQNANSNVLVSGLVSGAAGNSVQINGTYGFVSAEGVNSTQTPTGTVIFTNDNTYQGATLISGGSLQLGDSGTTGRLTATSGITNSGNLTIKRSDAFSQATDLGAGVAITGTGSFIQAGTGTTTLTTANTYTGGTNVTAGKLVVNNTTGSGTGTGTVTVHNGATLGGSGTIAGSTEFKGGSTHTPGNSPGTQTFVSNLTYNSDGVSVATVDWDLVSNSTTANDFDKINVGGSLNFANATVLSLDFDDPGSLVDWSNNFWASDRIGTDGWLVYNGATSLNNIANLSIGGNLLDAQGDTLSSARGQAAFSIFASGNNLYLNFVTGVPEPGTIGLLTLSSLAFAELRRRKLARQRQETRSA